MVILLIESDREFRDGLVGCLEQDGHRVLAYPSPEFLPGFHHLREVQAVITEHLTRGEDGLRFIERLRIDRPGIPAIIVTAYPEIHLEKTAAASSSLFLLNKPFRYEALARLLTRMGETDRSGSRTSQPGNSSIPSPTPQTHLLRETTKQTAEEIAMTEKKSRQRRSPEEMQEAVKHRREQVHTRITKARSSETLKKARETQASRPVEKAAAAAIRERASVLEKKKKAKTLKSLK
jgi:CheY-like chemotaxis protein